MSYKITIVGGGSSIFTPQLIALIIKSDLLKRSTVTLYDINKNRLGLMDQLCKQLISKTGSSISIVSTDNKVEALSKADFVVTSISVGGYDAWEQDLEIPGRYGIYTPFGDSIGPGGMMRAFRHIIPLVEICKELEECSPNAWVLNYTNPATVLAMAMTRQSSIKSVGLCTNTVYLKNDEFMSELTGVQASELVLPPVAAGINHCAGMAVLKLKDGRDAFPMVLSRTTDPIVKWGIETHGIIPYAPAHWIEFFPAFCQLKGEYKGKVQGMQMEYSIRVKDMTKEKQRVQNWETLVGSWIRGEGEASIHSIPKTEPVQAIEIMESLIADKKEIHVLNVVNAGSIENLPDAAIVEISAVVDGYGIRPIHVGKLPESVAISMRHHLDVQELTLKAGFNGDKKAALQAFEMDPIISAKLDLGETSKLLDELLLANKQYLPQFK